MYINMFLLFYRGYFVIADSIYRVDQPTYKVPWEWTGTPSPK